jgi:hypothetical protein
MDYTEQQEADFSVRNHLHVGEELCIGVNLYGKLTFSTCGASIDPPRRLPFKVLSEIGLLGLTSKDLEEISQFFDKTAKELAKIEQGTYEW